MEIRRRRRKQMMDDLKGKKGYRKLREYTRNFSVDNFPVFFNCQIN